MGRWHNRGNVRDKMATRWAGEKDWMIKRKEKTSPNDKYKFITYILNKMKLPRNTGNKKQTPRDLGGGDNTIHTRADRPAVQLCGDSNVACKWIHGELAQGTKYKETLGKIQTILHSWWKRKVATPISNIDSFVKHVYREHNQEADHWANKGAQGRRKIVIDRRDDFTTWKGLRGFRDGSFKDNGKSVCGIVIEGVDRKKGDTL